MKDALHSLLTQIDEMRGTKLLTLSYDQNRQRMRSYVCEFRHSGRWDSILAAKLGWLLALRYHARLKILCFPESEGQVWDGNTFTVSAVNIANGSWKSLPSSSKQLQSMKAAPDNHFRHPPETEGGCYTIWDEEEGGSEAEIQKCVESFEEFRGDNPPTAEQMKEQHKLIMERVRVIELLEAAAEDEWLAG